MPFNSGLPVRKSFLIGGAAIVAVAVVGFALTTFVFGGSGSSDTTKNVAAPSSPSVQQPTTGGAGKPPAAAAALPKNVLKPGGANPFTPKISGVKPPQAPAAPAATAPEPGSPPSLNAVDLATLHTWQLLDFEGGKATFLVDGKKYAKLSPGDKIVAGYTYNSVTGECVTVKKGSANVFGLCPGAAPFAQ